AVRAERENQLAVDRGRRARAGILRTFVRADIADARAPQFLPVVDVEALDVFVLHTLVADQVNTVANDGGSRVAAANIDRLPQQLGAIGRPFLQKTSLMRDAISVRPTPLRPISGRQRRTENQETENGKRESREHA